MQRVFGFEIYAASIVRPVLFIWQNGIEKSHICFRLICIPHAHAKMDEKWQKTSGRGEIPLPLPGQTYGVVCY